MRLVKCKKCGTTVMTDTTMIENMISEMNDLTNLIKKEKSNAQKHALTQQASQIFQMIRQINHRVSNIEVRKVTVTCELSEIVHYLRSNNLITDKKLDELREKARHEAEIKNEQQEKEIEKIYGDFESMLVNRSKIDITMKTAIKNM